MNKLLVLISIISVAFFQNPIISLSLGLILGFIIKDNLKGFISNVGSTPLQIGIVLIGFSISFKTFTDLLTNYFPIISIFVVITFLIGLLIGRLFSLDRKFIYLISSATAICGATAALAISSIIKAKPNQISLAVFIIFLMNAFALALFPIIGRFLGLTDMQFALFSALAIHDTASVVGSGFLYSDEAGEIATTLKVGRTIWIVPLIALIAFMENEKKSLNLKELPKFIILFFIVIAISNIFTLPGQIYEISKLLSIVFINIGIFFIALQSKVEQISDSTSLIYPILLWLSIVLISFVVVTSL
ncbi:putative sulfate exporter family transporter [Pseudomonadota bacterium]|nr:putative sulfate exporter family transporter [Pseudomonadota bacterium]